MNDLVSIIVTSYNHAEYLDQRMESLLNQTYPNIEIIVVDDCSTDCSAVILNKYNNLPHVQIVLLSENHGHANASNLGISLSHGDFLMFAECDDFNEPTHVKTLLDNMINDENVGVAYCRSKIVDEKGRVIGDDFEGQQKSFKKLCSHNTIIPRHKMQRFLLGSCIIPNMSAAMIRKKHVDHIKGFCSTYKVCADWDFWCRIADACDFFYASESLNNFRTHDTTVRSTSKADVLVSEVFQLLYNAAARTELTGIERCIFRINMGYVLAFYITHNCLGKFKNIMNVLKIGMSFEKPIIFYLLFGFPKVLFQRFNPKFFALFNPAK